MDFDFDVAVIGGGAGGGTLAAACAEQGRRVLLIERGRPAVDSARLDERATLLDKVPYDDRPITVDGRDARMYMGGVLGGGTAVFGAAMLRPAVGDFTPGRFYRRRLDPAVREWPVSYEQLRPWYEAAEKLYRVSRDSSDVLDPLEPVSSNPAAPPLPLAPINERFVRSAARLGVRPFRLPLAIDSTRCLRCDQCAGFVCPTGARGSAGDLVRNSVLRGQPLTVWTETDVTSLERSGGRTLDGIRVRHRSGTAERLVRARRYVLAAGAIGSPVLLQRSGFEHPLIGRNYMMHYSPLVIGLFPRTTEADRTFVKQIGLADWYFGTADLPEKMGIVQSLPAPGPLMLARYGLGRLPQRLLQALRTRMLPLVGIVEDLPDPNNRVTATGATSIALHYRSTDYDRSRGRELARGMARLLRAAGAVVTVRNTIPSREHVAHQCGTLRFGRTPRDGVTDADCRLFEQDDVFVADGSVLPTSLGVGPSLTIIANALRVAARITAET